MGLLIMILGLALFLGVRVLVSLREQRAALIANWGEGPYKISLPLVSALGLALIIYGFALYRQTGYIPLWSPPAWTRHVAAVALMLPAVICLLAAYVPGNINAASSVQCCASSSCGPWRIESPTATSARSSCSARSSPGPFTTAFR